MQQSSTVLTASNLQMHNSLVSNTRPPSGNPRRPPSSGISGIAGFGIGSSTTVATVAPSSVAVAVPRGCANPIGKNINGGNNAAAPADYAASTAAGSRSYAASTSRTVLSSRAANALASLELELENERQCRMALEERLTKLSKVVETMK
jgi:hypothetical protein